MRIRYDYCFTRDDIRRMQVPNLYTILGVTRSILNHEDPASDLREAYLHVASPYHEILTGSQTCDREHAQAMFELLTYAYEILSDPEQRSEYHDYLQGNKTIDVARPKDGGPSSPGSRHVSMQHSQDLLDGFAEMADIQRQIGSMAGFD